jgi:hypothetical protein
VLLVALFIFSLQIVSVSAQSAPPAVVSFRIASIFSVSRDGSYVLVKGQRPGSTTVDYVRLSVSDTKTSACENYATGAALDSLVNLTYGKRAVLTVEGNPGSADHSVAAITRCELQVYNGSLPSASPVP